MRFDSIELGQKYLDDWDARWADTRIHGTTKRQVAAMFAEEKAHLLPLPAEPLEFHYTPKHASWLNMVEIEIGVMVGQCLDRRIPDKATLVSEVAAWEQRRNAERATIKWLFTVEKARKKLARSHPAVSPEPAAAAAAAA